MKPCFLVVATSSSSTGSGVWNSMNDGDGEQIFGCQEGGGGTGSLGLVDANCCIWNG